MFVRVIGLRKGAPFYHVAPSIDVDYPRPTRICQKSRVFRVGRKGIVFGRWKETHFEEDESLRMFMRADLSKSPAVWGTLTAEHERLAQAQGGNLIHRP